MIRLKINDQLCESEEGSTIIEVADRYGISIPRFCYHSELSIAANCRMCLVEVSNSPRPVPACATPISDGLQVQTKSSKTQEAQKSVLEFLLINHPLDCPICDQGGECELQDLTLGYGGDHSHYSEEKRQVAPIDLGPLVATEMNRCIHCTRCVRFGSEISGLREIGALGRGEDTTIENALHQNLRSSVSANIIDLCPVGALTSKPHRYRGRTWQYQSVPAVAYHDSERSRMLAHIFRGQIRRMTSKGNIGSPDYWLSDRDRFGFIGMQSDRFHSPMVWQGSTWQPLSWALLYIKLNKLQETHKSWAAWFHPLSTLEEKKALKDYMSHLHSPQGVFELGHRKIKTLGQTEIALEQASQILLIGSFWESEHPVLLLNLRKWAAQEGHLLTQIGFIAEDLQVPTLTQKVHSPQDWEPCVKEWIAQNNSQTSYVVIGAQILNESADRIESLSTLLQKNNIRYTVLGLEAPFKNGSEEFQKRLCGSADVMVTLHLEAQDWTQDRLVEQLLPHAKHVVSFSSCLPKKPVVSGQICIPIAAPGEYEGSYASSWSSDCLCSPAAIAPPEGVCSFSKLIEQWLAEAPVVPHARPIPLNSLPRDGGAIYTDNLPTPLSQRESLLTLIVLKNPMALNMILRRCTPLQNTPTAQEQRGFWVGMHTVSPLCKELQVTDDLGQTYQDRAFQTDRLPKGVVLYWAGLNADEPRWGRYCAITEEIL